MAYTDVTETAMFEYQHGGQRSLWYHANAISKSHASSFVDRAEARNVLVAPLSH